MFPPFFPVRGAFNSQNRQFRRGIKGLRLRGGRGALGENFWQHSPRHLSPLRACALAFACIPADGLAACVPAALLQLLNLCCSHRLTHLVAVPTLWEALMAHLEHTPGLAAGDLSRLVLQLSATIHSMDGCLVGPAWGHSK